MDLLADIEAARAAMRKMGFEADTIFVSRKCAKALKRKPKGLKVVVAAKAPPPSEDDSY